MKESSLHACLSLLPLHWVRSLCGQGRRWAVATAMLPLFARLTRAMFSSDNPISRGYTPSLLCPLVYRVEKNGLQNIAKQDPGRAEQGTKSSNKVHQTMHNPLFSTL